jgi:hypothetical protein
MPLGPIKFSDPVNRRHRFNKSRLAWWLPLQSCAGGTLVFDLMNGHHGAVATLVGSISPWITSPPRFDNLFAFDHSKVNSPNITIANSVTGPLSLTDNFTIACWCYFTAQNGNNGLMARYNAASDNSILFRTFGSPTDVLEFGGSTTIHTTTTYTPLNRWVHCAATCKGGTGTIYINGADGGGSGAVSISVGTSGWRLGNVNGNSFGTSGYQGGWSIWNEPFSAQDILRIYREELAGNPTTLNRASMSLSGNVSFVPAPYYQMLQAG